MALPLFALIFILPSQASAAYLTQQLDHGMTNADVMSLQTFLATNATFYPEGLVTGYFGDMTEAAVSRFQSANGLSPVGRVGPLTLTAINGQMGGGTSSFSNDVSAPTAYPETVSVSTNTATISWTTDEAALGRVMYGAAWPFLLSAAPSVHTNAYDTMTSITLTGLSPRTTYFYVRESVDRSGNITHTLGKPVTTQ